MASVRVTTHCEGFAMTREKYLAVAQDYPAIRQYLEAVARLRLAASLERHRSVARSAAPSADDPATSHRTATA